MEQGCDVPSGTCQGSAGQQQLKHNTPHARFAATHLGNPREHLGVGAKLGVIDNFLLAAWILQPFLPQVSPPS